MAALPAVLVLLLLTAGLTVSLLGTQSPVSFLLGSYVVVWAEVVALAFALSIFHAFGRTGLLIGSAATFAVATAAWILRGRPLPPTFRPALRRLRAELADPALAILAATVVLVIAWAVVLGVTTPQNEWDSLTYHLTRAALWVQQGAVSYVPDVYDIRINGNPPNAEIGVAWTMLLGENDRFVWLPGLAAVLALLLGIFGIARRAGLSPPEALFGALIFACLPLVVLHASTALNDLVVASFFVAATFFGLGRSKSSAVGAGLSLGLGFGTKISAPLLLPIYLVVVLVARRRRVAEQVGIAALGVALGGVWYALNRAHTGALDGGMAAATGQIPGRQPSLIVTRAYRLLQNMVEAPGWSPFSGLFLACTVVLAIAAAVAYLQGRRPASLTFAAAAVIVYATPYLLMAEGHMIGLTWRAALAVAGRDAPAGNLTSFTLRTDSDSATAWYGPIGALLVYGGIVLAVRTAGRRRPLRLALALAPLLFLVVIAVGLNYDPWRGRFFLFPVALAAATWGLAHRYRALTWAGVGLTIVTVMLVLVGSKTKPLAFRQLKVDATASVFGKPRWRVQTWIRDTDGTAAVVRYFENHVAANASVALSLRPDDYSYPYFGEQLRRTIQFLPLGAPVPANVDWIVEAPGHDVPRCAGAWATTLETESGFHVLRRTAADTCPPRPLALYGAESRRANTAGATIASIASTKK